MRKVLVFVAAVLAMAAMATAVSACGCGGGKMNPEPIDKVLGKA
ncbi:MAG: hypothetical protein V2B18_23365 [Pseudomonadota bacterium]